ncbi:hypothetical protein HAX54_021061, partial [Datura stramonium]|nr:hypothetical protein [Datura stramonium]
MDQRVPHMLSWASVKQTPYRIIIDNFFHMEQVELDLAMEAAADVDGHLLESEDVCNSGNEACNKCQKIDEGKKPDEDVPCWDLITPPE